MKIEERRKNDSMEEVKKETERGFDKLLLEYEIRSRGMTMSSVGEHTLRLEAAP